MGLKKVIRMFKSGNVCVTGLRGTGKDMLIANVIARRKSSYVSNFDYKVKDSSYHSLEMHLLDTGNSFLDFITNDIKPYKYPYPEKADIYISDCGVYFPSQNYVYLNNKFGGVYTFQCLSRQLAQVNVHLNTQNLNRVWDKLREQSDQYILCLKCIVIGKLVFQKIRIYERADSCQNRIAPNRVRRPLLMKKELKMTYEMQHQKFLNDYGSIKNKLLIYFNKSNYDTRYFKQLLSPSLTPSDKAKL